MNIKSINPSNNEVMGEIVASSTQEVKDAVSKAHEAKKLWKELGVKKRVDLMNEVYDALYKRRDEIAKMDSQEMGFPITQCRNFNLGDGFAYFKWNLGNAEESLASEITLETDTEIHTVFREPRGVVAVIQPWNFPFCQFSWGVVANLLAGNTVVYKASEEVLISAKLIEEIVNSCNLPDGVMNFVYGDRSVGEELLKQDIDMIVFTGSTVTGQKLYKIAAEKFIPALLEMGGSAPGVIFDDVDVDEVVEVVFGMRFTNCGQTCDGLKRLIVHESIFDKVVEKLKIKAEAAVIGNPLDEKTDLGPLVSKNQLEFLETQFKDAIGKGAEIITGGKKPITEGFYFEPTILTNVKTNMDVWRDEVFGPILPIVKFKTEQEAIELANDSDYGLGAYVYTKDLSRAERVASKIDSGMVSINGTNYVLPMNPFGGYKNSGMGREHGKFGFHDVTQIKVVARNK